MSVTRYTIPHRWRDAPVWSGEIDAEDGDSDAIRLGKAVVAAHRSGARLYGARLDGASLYGARLDGASLDGASLDGANLYGARLDGANLYGASLDGANLYGARLDGARLDGARLDGARLDGAYWGAGATYGDGVLITRAPIIITGLEWAVLIFDQHMKIGCELHGLANWAAFDDRRIAQMEGARALRFWRANKESLLVMARANGREWPEVQESGAAA